MNIKKPNGLAVQLNRRTHRKRGRQAHLWQGRSILSISLVESG